MAVIQDDRSKTEYISCPHLTADCAGRGINWPEDENTHGGNRIIYPQTIRSEQMMEAHRKALERGINPFPRLSIVEARRLVHLLRTDRWFNAEQQLECQSLQQKACGVTPD